MSWEQCVTLVRVNIPNSALRATGLFSHWHNIILLFLTHSGEHIHTNTHSPTRLVYVCDYTEWSPVVQPTWVRIRCCASGLYVCLCSHGPRPTCNCGCQWLLLFLSSSSRVKKRDRCVRVCVCVLLVTWAIVCCPMWLDTTIEVSNLFKLIFIMYWNKWLCGRLGTDLKTCGSWLSAVV